MNVIIDTMEEHLKLSLYIFEGAFFIFFYINGSLGNFIPCHSFLTFIIHTHLTSLQFVKGKINKEEKKKKNGNTDKNIRQDNLYMYRILYV